MIARMAARSLSRQGRILLMANLGLGAASRTVGKVATPAAPTLQRICLMESHRRVIARESGRSSNPRRCCGVLDSRFRGNDTAEFVTASMVPFHRNALLAAFLG